MEHGKGLEYDHPYKLMVKNIGDQFVTNEDGYFSKMVLACGKQTAQSLFDIAKDKYENPSKYDFTTQSRFENTKEKKWPVGFTDTIPTDEGNKVWNIMFILGIG